MKKVLFGTIFNVLWMSIATFIVLEIFIRILTSYFLIYDMEMMKYSEKLRINSSIPGLTHEHRPNARAHLMGVDIALNSLGHRNAELINPKPKNERRIHFIGSSMLLGWGVPLEQGMVARVEKRLNVEKSPKSGLKYVGINAGIANYNTFYEVELFERQVEQTAPDLVVVQYYINDAEPNPTRSDSYILKKSLLAAFSYLRVKSVLQTSSSTMEEHYTALYKDGQPDWERTLNSMKKLKDICDKKGIPLVVLLVPEIHDFSKDNPYTEIYAKLEKTFSNLAAIVINPLDEMRQRFSDIPEGIWITRRDPHPNSAGHEVLANSLSNYLLKLDF